MKRRDFAIGLAGASVAGLSWPTADARSWSSGQSGLVGDAELVTRAWDAAASGEIKAIGRTDGFVIVQNGSLVFERYGPDYGPDTRHISWSMAKSVTHALVGIGVKQAIIDIDSPLIVTSKRNPRLSLRALLTLTDGVKWSEDDYDPATSDAPRLLYGPGRFDGAAYTAAKAQAWPPGTHWNYSTGSFVLAAEELQTRLFPEARDPEHKRAAMAKWIRSNLFTPLGMTTALAEFDPSGVFGGGSFVYASARDFARFGELYRCDGVCAGRRILPEGWVRFARTPTVEATYGAGFWLEASVDHVPASLMRGAGPMDAFSAQGHDGQIILIIPSKAVVIVRLGLMDDGDAAWKAFGEWITPIVNALPNQHQDQAHVG